MMLKKIILLTLFMLFFSAYVIAEGWVPQPPPDEDQPPAIDFDGDGIPEASDNCPFIYNPGQMDSDNDGIGDVCDSDTSDDHIEITEVNVDVDGKGDKITSDNQKIDEKAKAESDISFRIKVKNTLQVELQDIDIEVNIRDIDDGSDLRERTSLSNLDPEATKTGDVDFELPLEIDDGNYDVDIHVEGIDINHDVHSLDWTLDLEVRKDRNEVEIRKADILPSTVNCGDTAELNLEVLNLGRDDEEISIQMNNPLLGSLLNVKDITLGTGTDDDAMYEKTYKLRIASDIQAGVYPLDIKVYYNKGDVHVSKEVDLAILCDNIKEVQNVEPVQVTKTQTIPSTSKVQTPNTQTSYSTDDSIIILALIILIIFLGGFGIFLTAVLIGVNKK